jgi:uncharacterized Zn-finger protein
VICFVVFTVINRSEAWDTSKCKFMFQRTRGVSQMWILCQIILLFIRSEKTLERACGPLNVLFATSLLEKCTTCKDIWEFIQKPFSCSQCAKSFSLSGELRKHLRVHTGEKPYSCSYCNKSFALSGAMKAHLRVHTGEKPFNCTLCDKSFAQSSDLRRHLTVHSGEKAHSCNQCTKSFVFACSLQKHLKTHAGKKFMPI